MTEGSLQIAPVILMTCQDQWQSREVTDLWRGHLRHVVGSQEWWIDVSPNACIFTHTVKERKKEKKTKNRTHTHTPLSKIWPKVKVVICFFVVVVGSERCALFFENWRSLTHTHKNICTHTHTHTHKGPLLPPKVVAENARRDSRTLFSFPSAQSWITTCVSEV